MPDLRPAKLRFLKTFRIKTNAGSIPKYNFDSVGPFCTEDIKRAIEWIAAGVTDQGQQAVYALAKIDRVTCQKHFDARRDHAERTARIPRRKCVSSAVASARMTTPPTTISIT